MIFDYIIGIIVFLIGIAYLYFLKIDFLILTTGIFLLALGISFFLSGFGKKVGTFISFSTMLFFSIIVTYLFAINYNLNFKGEKIESRVYYVEKYYKDDVEKFCIPYIKYIVDGKEYKNKSDIFSCSYKENDVIKIKYDKNNPNHFQSKSYGILYVIILPIIYIVFIIVIKNILNQKRTKNIIK